MAETTDPGDEFEAQPLWIDRIAERTGANTLAESLFGSYGAGRGPQLVIGTILVLNYVIPVSVVFVRTGTLPISEIPARLLGIPIWLYVLTHMQSLHRRYEAVVQELITIDDVTAARLREEVPELPPDEPDAAGGLLPSYEWWLDRLGLFPGPVPATRFDDEHDDPTAEDLEPVFEQVVPDRVILLCLVGALSLYGLWFLIDPRQVAVVAETLGPVFAVIDFYVLIPVLFYGIGAEFVALLVGVHVLLPLKATASHRIDFTDPSGFGGLRPVGRLLRFSSSRYVVFLGIFVVFEWVARGTGPFDLFSQIVVVSGTVLGALLLFGPAYWLHKFMKRKKEERLRVVTDFVAATGPDDDVFPNTLLWREQKYPDYNRDDFHEYAHLNIHLTRVENAKEYPIDVSIALEFLFVLLLPYLAHVSSIYVFENLLHG